MKEYPGGPGYWVTEDGRVRGPSGKWLKPAVGSHGYLTFNMSLPGQSRTKRSRSVHVVVCETYHGPRPPGMVARHLDGNPLNNQASNLAWGTRAENAEDARRHGTLRHGETHWKAKLTRAEVDKIKQALAEGVVTGAALAKQYGVSQQTICDIKKGRLWK